jgi:hypothetical protein
MRSRIDIRLRDGGGSGPALQRCADPDLKPARIAIRAQPTRYGLTPVVGIQGETFAAVSKNRSGAVAGQ